VHAAGGGDIAGGGDDRDEAALAQAAAIIVPPLCCLLCIDSSDDGTKISAKAHFPDARQFCHSRRTRPLIGFDLEMGIGMRILKDF
jgi:hypothetical protein